MKRIITLAFSVLLLSILCTIAFAQDKTQAYYVSHQTEILTDAQAAFRKGEYELAEKLCSWHYIIVGDKRADALREKAEKCAKLAIEMNTLASYGNRDAAREKARAILALNPDDTIAQQLLVNLSKNKEDNHEWVDLGLSVKWATCNVGATKPEEYGDYFAWGETRPKSEYTWENYKYRVSGNNPDNVTFSKYNTKSERGTVDNKKHLELSDDAARANWGGSWRMPTVEECRELWTNCTWTWTKQGGKNGYKVTSKTNGNSIFLPAAGYRGSILVGVDYEGDYCSSSLDTAYPYFANSLHFNSNVYNPFYGAYRYDGFSVRPVME